MARVPYFALSKAWPSLSSAISLVSVPALHLLPMWDLTLEKNSLVTKYFMQVFKNSKYRGLFPKFAARKNVAVLVSCLYSTCV